MIGSPPRKLAVPVMVCLGLIYALPLLWMALTAFKSDSESLVNPNSVIFAPTLDSFSSILLAGSGAIVTSVQIATAVTVLVLLVAVPAAYALSVRVSRFWARVSALVLGAFLVLQMVPQPMAVIPLYGILAQWDLVDSLAGVVLADLALLTPFAVLILRPFVLAIPPALYEAAALDGASQFRVFRSVVLPLMVNGVATVSAIVFIIAWGEFIYATTLIVDPASLPVSGLLARQNSLYAVSWNNLMGLGLLTSIPLLIVFLFARRRLTEGLSVGAIK